ncbi:MAG TPA: hypothetical protein VKT53_01360 [Candidatus Acidoferrum sp.]|nr:hypothetical protein [Candidatus Acidoferrum sp.]
MRFSLVLALLLLPHPALERRPNGEPRAQGPAKPVIVDSPDPDSDEVYAAILAMRVRNPGEGPKAKQIVLMDTTVGLDCMTVNKSEDCLAESRKRIMAAFGSEVDIDAVEDFLKNSTEQVSTSKNIPIDLPQVFLSKKEVDELFKKKHADGWKVFYDKYPGAGGITSLSRVGFNKARDCAVLYSAIGCGWLCGTGHYHLLKKESGKWKLVASHMLWIS